MAGLRARAHLEAPLAVVAHVKAECGVELGLQRLRATVNAGTLLARRRLWARRWLRRETRGTAALELCHRLRRLIVEAVVLFVLGHRFARGGVLAANFGPMKLNGQLVA